MRFPFYPPEYDDVLDTLRSAPPQHMIHWLTRGMVWCRESYYRAVQAYGSDSGAARTWDAMVGWLYGIEAGLRLAQGIDQ